MSNIIQSLWIGEALSKLELLCISSFLYNGFDFHLYTYNHVLNVPRGVVVKSANEVVPASEVFSFSEKSPFYGSYAGFSNVFRYKLLYDVGGWWVDLDVTCLREFNFENEYVWGPSPRPCGLATNVMKCPAGAEVMKTAYEETKFKLTPDTSEWGISINILAKHVKKMGLMNYVLSDYVFGPRGGGLEQIHDYLYGSKDPENVWRAIHWKNELWRRNGIDKNSKKGDMSLFERLKCKYHV